MGGLLFAVAFLATALVLVGRVVVRRLRVARLGDTVVVASLADIPGVLRRRRCPCGRLPDEMGELSTTVGTVVQRECVCGRLERVTFVLGN
jgi:hypothetical protein